MNDNVTCPFCADRKPVHQTHAELSQREAQVLRLIVDGKTAEQIAKVLKIAHKTAAKHRENIYTKAKLKNTAMAVQLGLYLGLAEPAQFPNVKLKTY